MLLNNKSFGPILRQWEEKKSMSRQTKYKASTLIILSFSITITLFHDNTNYVLLLIAMAIVLLLLVWRIKEEKQL